MDPRSVTVDAPPSKSLSHRMVIAASLAAGESTLGHVLESDDLARTMDVLRGCGARIRRTGQGSFVVQGTPVPAGGPPDMPLSCDVGESGTTCRLLAAVLASGLGDFLIHGRGRMHQRPMGELLDALASLGASVQWRGRAGCPPFLVSASGLRGGSVSISMDESSQYLSGLLLAAPLARDALTVELGGTKAVSWPYAALTLQTLEDFGITFAVETRPDPSSPAWERTDWRSLDHAAPGLVRFRVRPGMYRPGEYRAEGDWSSASYFLAAGAVGPRPVTVRGLRRDSLQGDKAMLDILARMGASVAWSPDGSVTVSPARGLRGLDIDMGHCPDLAPTAAAVAALAQGVTTIRGVAHLRIKESDRLAAPAAELARLGARVEVLDDGLRIEPGPVPAGRAVALSCHGDHRMAMALSLFSLAGVDVRLDDPGCVAKSFPGFFDAWAEVVRS